VRLSVPANLPELRGRASLAEAASSHQVTEHHRQQGELVEFGDEI
jgi:hypothetical protein